MKLTFFKKTPLLFFALITFTQAISREKPAKFKVLAFYTARNDLAHVSFVNEANIWFLQMANKHHFQYDATSDWSKLNADYLKNYKLILFLDTRPEKPEQRMAFEQYIEKGGAWMGFHFAGFALNDSDFPQNWNWYHQTFLGCNEFKSNTWRPTSAVLQTENRQHPTSKKIPRKFKSAPSEWYRWTGDLRSNKDINVLLSIHPDSFPLGTGPKPDEIWHEGDYPVAWTNKKYKMVYMNMGHNDMDYEGGTNATVSHSFSSKAQNQFILNSMFWLAMGQD